MNTPNAEFDKKLNTMCPDWCKWSWQNKHEAAVSDLIGKTVTAITVNEDNDMLMIECSDDTAYLMFHEQDCCESVEIEDICGDLNCLIGSPLLRAEERVSTDRDKDENAGPKDNWDDSYTWTFYTFATVKGYVDIRWYGTSNGYYSESVDFVRIK